MYAVLYGLRQSLCSSDSPARPNPGVAYLPVCPPTSNLEPPLATPRHPAHPPTCTSAHCQGGQHSPLRPAAHRLLNSQPLPAQPLAFLCLDSVPAPSSPPHSRHCTGDGIRRHHSNTTIVVPHVLKNGRQLTTPNMILPVIQAPLPWH